MEGARGGYRPTSSARKMKAQRQLKGASYSGSHTESNHGLAARPGSVPLLWDKDCADLAIHSTSLSLATRSLTSGRSSTSSSSRRGTGGRRRRTDASHHGTVRKRSHPPVAQTESLQSTSSPDIGLTGRSGGVGTPPRTLSLDIDKFLLDVNSALRAQSPSPPPSPVHEPNQIGMSQNRSEKGTSTSRPTVAAKFTGRAPSSEGDSAQARITSSKESRMLGTGNRTSTGEDGGLANEKGVLKQEAQLPAALGNGEGLPATSEPTAPEGAGNTSTEPREVRAESAAVKIQRWYRQWRKERATREVQSFLLGKKDELNRSRKEEREKAQEKQEHEAELQKRRLAKMQAVRKAAIEDLQRRREEKRQNAEKIAQEEIALLQASGKIKKSKAQGRPRKAGRAGGGEKEKTGEEKVGGTGRQSSVPDSVIDEFFEGGATRQQSTAPPPPVQRPGDTPHTTYNDILDTLRLLEAEPVPINPPGPSDRTTTGGQGYLSAQNLHKLERSDQYPPENGKLRAILSYLDEVEQVDTDLASQEGGAKTKIPPTPITAMVGTSGQSERLQEDQGRQQEQLEAATAVASDVTTTILAQRMELDNKQKTVEMLQKALSQQRELTVYHAKEMEKEGQRRLDLQQREYEETVQRHQTFIDQLIDDKKVLSERCGTLVTELKNLDVKYKQTIKGLEESHAAELSKVKQVTAAADKLRREKWRADESQRIKEATVKGLEPEIQRIIAKGKAEIQRLKALHEAELLQADERASRRFVAQMEDVRAQCAQEKEQACAHERELARQRYEKLAEQEEISYQQQRRKLFHEVQQEKDKLFTSIEQQRAELEREWRERQEAQRIELEEMKTQHARTTEEAQRRHGSELRALEERLGIERASWEENYRKRQEVILMEKERDLREGVRRDRDKEIEMVIARLEEETAESKAECERAAEARIKRIREKYEAELREVERSERSTMEKFNTMRGDLTDRDSELVKLRGLLRQKEAEVEQVSEVASKLTQERDGVTDIVRQEFADRLVVTEDENRRLKVEMSELRARHRLDLEQVSKEKERQMEEVHTRVKQALARKEENLKALRAQHEAALKRANHLEMLLERQRKELLKK